MTKQASTFLQDEIKRLNAELEQTKKLAMKIIKSKHDEIDKLTAENENLEAKLLTATNECGNWYQRFLAADAERVSWRKCAREAEGGSY